MNKQTNKPMTDAERTRKLKALSAPALVVIDAFVHLLLFWEWVRPSRRAQ